MRGYQNLEFDHIFITRHSMVVEMITGAQDWMSEAYRYLTTIFVPAELLNVIMSVENSKLQSKSNNHSICL